MQKNVLEIAISGLTIVVLDGAFIGTNLSTYKSVIQEIQGSEMKLKRIEAIAICYLCLIGGLYYFILREKKSIFDAFWFGVVIYGVYATTVYTMFKEYPAYLAGIDMLWGGLLMASTTGITRWVMEYMV